MAISYKKLWHRLIDQDMTKTELLRTANLSWGSMAKLNHGENVNTVILLRICTVLKCNIGDIMDIIPDEHDEECLHNIKPRGTRHRN